MTHKISTGTMAIIFARNTQTMIEYLQAYESTRDVYYELEVRYGVFTSDGFKSEVTLAQFNRIRELVRLNKYTDLEQTVYLMSYGDGNIRKTVMSQPVQSETWQYKERMHILDLPEYGIRYAISKESQIDEYSAFVPDMQRDMLRRSYIISGLGQLDMTIIRNDDPTKNKYEIEFEMVSDVMLSREKRERFSQQIVQYYLHINKTSNLYSLQTKGRVFTAFNAALGVNNRPHSIDRSLITLARNIKYSDLVWGGLIGYKTRGREDVHYSVTPKADGLRQFLYIVSNQLWLLSVNGDADLIGKLNNNRLNNTILDVESILYSKRIIKNGAPKIKYWLLVLDCLVYSGTDVRDRPLNIRLNYGQQVADTLNIPNLQINTKRFESFRSASELFSIMRELGRLNYAYQTDGYIFVPNQLPYIPYQPNPDTLPLYKRCLVRIPDLVKWKPQAQITIDLMLSKKLVGGQFQIDLLTSEAVGRGFDMVSFRGDNITPLDINMIDIANPLIQESVSGTVLEFEWNHERNMLVPIGKRNDKRFPNKKDIALDNWNHIRDPILLDTMEGQTLRLMRKYHNRIKRSLFQQAAEKYNNPDLLDIGSGRGGDVINWNRYNRIVAIEPDYLHTKHLIERLLNNDIGQNLIYWPRDDTYEQARVELLNVKVINNVNDISHGGRVLIVQAGGEDSQLITQSVTSFIGRKVDVIAMMFSLTFFWESQDKLNALLRTIIDNSNNNSSFIYTTMDGNAVQQVFRPPLGGLKLSELEDRDGLVTMKYNDDVKPVQLEIKYGGTIVGDDELQTEWLVHNEDLIMGLGTEGFKQEIYHRMQDEYLLSELETRLTQLYYYGIFNRGRKEQQKTQTVITDLRPIPLVVIPISRPPVAGHPQMLDVAGLIRAYLG